MPAARAAIALAAALAPAIVRAAAIVLVAAPARAIVPVVAAGSPQPAGPRVRAVAAGSPAQARVRLVAAATMPLPAAGRWPRRRGASASRGHTSMSARGGGGGARAGGGGGAGRAAAVAAAVAAVAAGVVAAAADVAPTSHSSTTSACSAPRQWHRLLSLQLQRKRQRLCRRDGAGSAGRCAGRGHARSRWLPARLLRQARAAVPNLRPVARHRGADSVRRSAAALRGERS